MESSVSELAGKTSELEDRLRKVEDTVAKQSVDADSLRTSLSAHESTCKARFDLLEARQAEQASVLDKMVVPSSRPSEPSTIDNQASVPVNANADMPYEQHTVAKIEGFVYDT